MGYYYFKCRSVTYAQRASKYLYSKGVYSSIVKLPIRYSEEGCGYSLKVSERQFLNSRKLLSDVGYEIQKILYSDNEGEYKEVAM